MSKIPLTTNSHKQNVLYPEFFYFEFKSILYTQMFFSQHYKEE